eukprot:1622486-Amphidinium_carterae.3
MTWNPEAQSLCAYSRVPSHEGSRHGFGARKPVVDELHDGWRLERHSCNHFLQQPKEYCAFTRREKMRAPVLHASAGSGSFPLLALAVEAFHLYTAWNWRNQSRASLVIVFFLFLLGCSSTTSSGTSSGAT